MANCSLLHELGIEKLTSGIEQFRYDSSRELEMAGDRLIADREEGVNGRMDGVCPSKGRIASVRSQ